MSNILEFFAYINRYRDVARTDRFSVDIIPSNVFYTASYPLRNLTYQCEAAELPPRAFQTFDSRTYGPTVKNPYQTAYTDLQLSFFCVTNGLAGPNTGLPERRFFEDWMEFINPSEDNNAINKWNFKYKNEYVATIILTHYDMTGAVFANGQTQPSPTYIVRFFNVFPILVGGIAVNWADPSIAKLPVVFSYSHWERKNNPVIPPTVNVR